MRGTAVDGRRLLRRDRRLCSPQAFQALAIILVRASGCLDVVLPLLTSANLERDLAEDLALGKEWQLGYWKHPPLPGGWPILPYRITGHIGVVYARGRWRSQPAFLASICSRATLSAWSGFDLRRCRSPASISTITRPVKVRADQMQLPFWAFDRPVSVLRALLHGRMLNWALAGRDDGAMLLVEICSLRAR